MCDGRHFAYRRSEALALYVIGEEESKRTVYMKKAADSMGVPFRFAAWKELRHGFDLRKLYGAAVKIDPPAFSVFSLEKMKKQIAEYIRLLRILGQAECIFLNAPEAMIRLLDKKQSKQCLQEHGLSVTQMFPAEIQSVEQLLEWMQQIRCYAVFVKPRFFSGAAGVAAFRMHPYRGKMVLYTSCRMEGTQLINTKKLFCMRDREEIRILLERLLSLECVVERWHPKAEVQGKSFDLRAVYQFGHIAHIVVRCSKGPITNLHLNNQALELQALGLSGQTMQELEELCGRAVSLFPGLTMAGIDLLLEKGSWRPRIIEMNGQGDLIYQDIYAENRIYCEQVRMMGEIGNGAAENADN